MPYNNPIKVVIVFAKPFCIRDMLSQSETPSFYEEMFSPFIIKGK